MVLFGAFVFWRESKRGRRQQAIGFVIGIPGLYLCLISQWNHIYLLLVPGVAVMLAGYVVQYRALKKTPRDALPHRRSVLRSARQSKDAPAERRYDEW